MDFALDRKTGEKIFPANAIRHRRYLCPCCKKEVTVRSVGMYSLRAPHFAHLKGRADRNCENFFESIGSNFTLEKIYHPVIPKVSETKIINKFDGAFSKNLYLRTDGDVWKLYFQFHTNNRSWRWSGQLSVECLNGVRMFNSATIVGKHDMEVDFNFSRHSVSRSGHVEEEVWSAFVTDIPEINGNFNFFHAPYSNGRMLGDGEALVLGETYILATTNALNIPDFLSENIQAIQAIQAIQDINYYKIDIPISIEREKRDFIENLFSRLIQNVRPDFKILDPLPKCINIDGTVNIPLNAKLIVVQFNCDPSEVDYKILGGVGDDETVKISQNYLIVDATKVRGVEIFWLNSIMMRVEKKSLPEVRSNSIDLLINEARVSLLNAASAKDLSDGTKFRIDSNSPGLEKIVAIYRGLSPVELNSSLVFGPGLIIDAGSFGYFQSYSEDVQQDCALSTEEKVVTDSIGKWVNSLALIDRLIVSQSNNGIYRGSILEMQNKAGPHMRLLNKRKITKR